MFNNYGIAIQYYENKIATVKNKQGVDSLEVYQLMRGLSNALIEKYKNSSEGIDGIEKKDAQRITDALEQNIQRTVSHGDVYDRRQKSIDCYRWFRYAPYGNSSIAQAFVVSDKWQHLDSINGHNTTPFPFYYEYVLLVLRLGKTSVPNVELNIWRIMGTVISGAVDITSAR